MDKKPIRKWVTLLIIPLPLIIFAALLQAFVLFSSPGADPTFFGGLLSVISLLAGVAGVVLLLGFPLWLIKLIRAQRHNKQSESQR